MARYDKYEPYAGGFRALLAADWLDADKDKAIGVGLNANGLVVKGAGNTGVVAVLVVTKGTEDCKAGDVIDNMTDGEITEFGGTPGTNYFADPATGVLSANSGAGKVKVGHTAEGGRLIVRVAGSAVA